MDKVLVTGGSGFVAGHVIQQLLANGYAVRTTIRTPARADPLREALQSAGTPNLDRLEFAVTDLLSDDGWSEAAADCRYVQHVASPYTAAVPKDENELIRPALEGTIRVLRAAHAAGVERVVLTSSFAAIGYGHKDRPEPLTEEDWSNLEGPDIQAYEKSKTFAERAAWDFVAGEGKGMELSVVNPSGVFGPVMGSDFATSIGSVQGMLRGKMPAVPRVYLGVVDVRDLADLHLRAMVSPEAAGHRFLGVAGPAISLLDMAGFLRRNLGDAAAKVPAKQMPDWLFRVIALFNPQSRTILPSLGLRREASGEKARRVLGWTPRSSEEAIVATAESLLRLNLV